MKVKGLVLLIIVFILLVVGGFIGFNNGQIVRINYLIAETEITMSWLLAFTFFVGLIFNLLFFIPYVLRLKWQLNMLSRKNKKLAQGPNLS